MRSARPWSWTAGVGAAVLSALVIGVPTDVIDTDLFTRMTPVRPWEYPVLAVAAVLTGLWMAIPRDAGELRGRAGVVGATTAVVFAVGCPICNKIVVGLLGVSGALGVWAPLQPALAALSLAALAAAVVLRWRRRDCTPDTCVTGDVAPDIHAYLPRAAVSAASPRLACTFQEPRSPVETTVDNQAVSVSVAETAKP